MSQTTQVKAIDKLKSIEEKWQKRWDEIKLYEPEINEKPSEFVTFPYPYVNGPIHIGHAFTCNKVDIYARFKRLMGYNVLFPFAFHATGEPIVGTAKRVKKNDKDQINALLASGISRSFVKKFIDPEFIASYWREEVTKAAKNIGWGIDWRRPFITIEPLYKEFVTWQYLTLKKRGYIQKGTHNVIFCPACQSPTGDHDRLEGEGASPVQFALVKFEITEDIDQVPKGKKKYLVAATLRPETIYGATNVWFNPEGDYSLIKIDDSDEYWIVSKTGAFKLREQLRSITTISEFKGKEYLGIYAKNPVNNTSIPVLPADFVDPEHSSGVVYSVPGHAPFDYLALKDLQENPDVLEKYGIDKKTVMDIELINVVTTSGEFKTQFPGKEVVEDLGVKNQNDPKAIKATDIVYKKEFHRGIMSDNTGNFAGKKVSEIKDELISEFQKINITDSLGLWETSETVICRSNDKCIVKTLQDQWFLDYGNPVWKEKTKIAFEKMNIYPKEAISAFNYTRNWLKAKACARKSGLGTKLPWDAESGWIVETLSDSTIYMSFYTIIHKIREWGLTPEQLKPEFFDYVFLNSNKPAVTTLSKKIGVTTKQLKELRDEFNYWYPVTLRISGKDLIYNHLSFFLFQHVAIWEKFPDKWPRQIGAGGMLGIDNQKMSKSRGNFITLKEGLEIYGADAIRMGLAYSDEGFDDPNFSRKATANFVDKLVSIYEQFITLSEFKYKGKPRHMDKWLENRVKDHINITKTNYEQLKTRNVVSDAFFGFLLDLRWYKRRESQVSEIYNEAIETFVLLIAPIIPHIAEEVWESWHSDQESIFREHWPAADKYTYHIDVDIFENSLKRLIQDIKNLLGIVKDNIDTIDLYVAESWKYDLVNLANSVPNKELIKEAMKNPSLKKKGKLVSTYAKKMLRQQEKLGIDINLNLEKEFLDSTKIFLLNEFKDSNIKRINVLSAEDEVDTEKLKRADPLRPAILLK
ncbi:MAG: Leucine--tRNA ligase [Candidatus Heimdallarchaeota archaeon LC_3]|nr:MAG: Leucine--tRNA ligase [Candidatus Heimdallarchaeota archaeon LC_3]